MFSQPQFTVILIAVIFVMLIFLMIRVRFKAKAYEFDLVLMRPGVNKHIRISNDELEFEHTENGKKYKINPDRIARVKVGRITSAIFRVRGIKKRFLIVFQHKKTESISAKAPKVSGRVLKQVNESRALGKAMSSEFKLPMDLKKILLIMGFIVVVIIAYVLVTGEVAI